MAVSNAIARTMAMWIKGLIALALLAGPMASFAQTAQPARTIFEAFAPASRQENAIRLRSSCRVVPGASVTLGDMAILEGPLAQNLAGVVIIPAGDVGGLNTLEVSIAQVRSALASHDSTLEGRVLVSGSTTRVWVAASSPAADARPAPNTRANAQHATSKPGVPTVRDAVVEKIAGVLGMPIDAVRARFEPQDEDFLSMPTPGRTVAASPTGTGERIGVVVRVYERDRVVASKSLRVGVAVRQSSAIATTAIERGEMLTASSFRIEERDVPPGTAIADPSTLVGRSARSRLAPGRIIQVRDVESPVLVSRGDIVTIECLSGGILLKTSGRARGSGREGDIVSFEPLRRGRPFEARIAGPGRAVAISESDSDPTPGTTPSLGTPLASAFMPDASTNATEPVSDGRSMGEGATGFVGVPLP